MLRVVAKKLCTDAVYEQHTWKAASKGKMPFILYKELNDVMFLTVRRSYAEFTEHEYSSIMQDYLKHAKFRMISKMYAICSVFLTYAVTCACFFLSSTANRKTVILLGCHRKRLATDDEISCIMLVRKQM